MRLRREIASVIRRHRPDVVITLNHHETWGGRVLNQADHRVVGSAVLDAVRDAGNRRAFGDLRGTDRKSLPKWDEVQFTAVANSPAPTHAVDVTDSIDAGIESLRCHAAYLAGLGAKAPDPDRFLRDAAQRHAGQVRRATGRRLRGVPVADLGPPIPATARAAGPVDRRPREKPCATGSLPWPARRRCRRR